MKNLLPSLPLALALLCGAGVANATTIDTATYGNTFGLVDDQVGAVPVAGASKYEFEFSQNGTVLHTLISTTPVALLSDASPALQYGETYDVSVRASIGGSFKPFGASCPLIIVAQAAPPVTSLVSTDCGRLAVKAKDVIAADFVPGTDYYRFTLSTKAGVAFTVQQASRFLSLQDIDVNPGTLYSVRVDVARDNEETLGDSASACQITMLDQLTTLRPTDCGQFYGLRGDAVAVVGVGNSAAYQFSFLRAGIEVANYTGVGETVSFDSLGTALKYGKTYSVKARAVFANGTRGSYGTACDIYTVSQAAPPATRISAADCGRTGMLRTDVLTADAVTAADAYRFRIKRGSVMVIDTMLGAPTLSLDHFGKRLNPGTTYNVTVSARRDNVSTNGSVVCTFRMRSVPTQLATKSVGGTFGIVGDKVFADTVVGTSGYRFSFRQNGVEVGTGLGNTAGRIKLSVVLPALNYSNTYDVFVAPVIGNQTQDYTTSAQIQTISAPLPPTSKLRTFDCGRTVGTADYVLADKVLAADAYRFFFYDANNVYLFDTTVLRPRLDLAPLPLAANVTYKVRVNVFRDKVFSTGTTICSITTTSASRLGAGSSDALAAYPNPFASTFTVELPSASTVTVMDMQGRALQTMQANGTTTLGEGLAPGTYQVRVTDANGTQTLRMTKAGR